MEQVPELVVTQAQIDRLVDRMRRLGVPQHIETLATEYIRIVQEEAQAGAIGEEE